MVWDKYRENAEICGRIQLQQVNKSERESEFQKLRTYSSLLGYMIG